MLDILNLALPFFGLIFIGFACGKLRQIPDAGLAWMNSLDTSHRSCGQRKVVSSVRRVA